MRAFVAAGLLTAITLLPSSDARAGDMLRPATPAVFLDVPCSIVVDRSKNAVLHLEYDVSMDDSTVGADEVADGRRLQFFAMRKQNFGPPPNWITRADIDAAMSAPATAGDAYEDVGSVDSSNVLEESADWGSEEWFRINEDDARIPISHAQAAQGIDWDTTSVPQGAYVVWAYTWDPVINAWVQRWGMVKVVDDASIPADSPPALYLRHDDSVIQNDGEYTVRGCVDAMPGSTVTLSYAMVSGLEDPVWLPIETRHFAGGGELSVPFSVPSGCRGEALRFRGEIEDPEGRRYVAYAPGKLTVLGTPPEGARPCDEPPTGAGGGGCRMASEPFGCWGLVFACAARRRRRSRRRRR